MAKRLYRKESEKVLGGVCAGLADFLGIDSVFVRIFFFIWTVMGELSVLIYIILWIVVPLETAPDADESFEVNEVGARFQQMGREIGDIARKPSQQLITFTGLGLVAWGIYEIAKQAFPVLNIWNYSQYLWPAMLIIAGGFIIFRATRKGN